MKTLKFADPLVPLVLSGQKTITWRLNDQKDLTVNDTLSCLRLDGSEFAQAKILWVKTTTFKNLTLEDQEGHEKFSSNQEMLDTYSKYYNQPVNTDTVLKVVKFELINSSPNTQPAPI